MSAKERKIQEAKLKIQGIELVLAPLQKQLEHAQFELRQAEASYDMNERVKIFETCDRGCCHHHVCSGTIVAVPTSEKRGYTIRGDDGKEREGVWPAEMERIEPITVWRF